MTKKGYEKFWQTKKDEIEKNFHGV